MYFCPTKKTLSILINTVCARRSLWNVAHKLFKSNSYSNKQTNMAWRSRSSHFGGREAKTRLIFRLASCTADFTRTLKRALSHSARLSASVKQCNTVNRALERRGGCKKEEKGIFPFLNKGLIFLTKFHLLWKQEADHSCHLTPSAFQLWHFSLNLIGHGDNETTRGCHCEKANPPPRLKRRFERRRLLNSSGTEPWSSHTPTSQA